MHRLLLSCACEAILAGALFLGAAAVSAAEPAGLATHVINIEGMQFNPKDLTVRKGDRIIWANKDLVPHSAAADTKAFDSSAIAPNASWSYVATRPGIYPYGCAYHPTMRASLRVLP